MPSKRRLQRNAERNARRYMQKFAEADNARQAEHDLAYAVSQEARACRMGTRKNQYKTIDFINPREKAGQCFTMGATNNGH